MVYSPECKGSSGQVKVSTMFNRNRSARLEQFKGLKTAAVTKKALSWSMGQEPGERRVTARSLPAVSVGFVRDYLNHFNWPQKPSLQFGGRGHTAQRLDDHNVTQGVVTIHGTVRSPIGVPVNFSVPVEIREGHMLEPSIMCVGNGNDQDNGFIRIISQTSIDEMVRNSSAYSDMPQRKEFAPPAASAAQSQVKVHQERRTPGMFHMSNRQSALREFVRTGGARGLGVLAPPSEDELVHRLAQTLSDPGSDLDKIGQHLREALGAYKDQRTEEAWQNLDAAKNLLANSQQGRLGNIKSDRDAALRHNLSTAYYHILNRLGGDSEHDQGLYGVEPETPDWRRDPTQRGPDRVAQAQDDGSEVAETDEDNNFSSGASVRVTRHLRAPTRGGPYWDIKKGATGKVIRDMAGDRCDIYVEMSDGCKCVIPGKYLKVTKAKKTAHANF